MMPARWDTREEKWLLETIDLGDGIVIEVRELQAVRDWTTNSRDAVKECAKRGIHPVKLRECKTADGYRHNLVQVGGFAIDHAREWVALIEDLDYIWL